MPPQDINFMRPWSTSQDAALPLLRSRSVTGWPHHLIPQLCRVPASTGRSPKPPRPGAAPGRHGAAHGSIFTGDVADKEGTCLASSLMRERYPPSPPLSLGVVPASRVVLRTAVKWCRALLPSAGLEHYHQLPPFTHSKTMGSEAEVVEAHGCQPCH